MDKDQVITAIKKNILSILAGVAALLAIGFMLFWLNGKYGEVKQAAQLRASKANEIQTLRDKQRGNIQFTSATTEPLDGFPTNRKIAVARETMEGVKAQAEQVLEQAQEINRRVPLGYESFEDAAAEWPLEGNEAQAQRQSYKAAYSARINADNSRFDSNTGAFAEGTLQAQMGATRPPSSAELETMASRLEATLISELPAGETADTPEFQARLAQERVTYASGMKYARAQKGLIYIDPSAAPGSDGPGFTVHPIATTGEPTAVDCFNAQVGLWVQEAVGLNLARANREVVDNLPSEQQNLLNAPVKHLLSVDVPLAPFGEAAAAAEEGAAEPGAPVDTGAGLRRNTGRPPDEAAEEEGEPEEEEAETEESVLEVDPTAVIEREYQRSPSGRPLHTPFYDLVQFRVKLRCAADAVPYVLKQLQSESFVSVLNVRITSVDPAVAAREGYVYGNQPVVELDLACEMPFLRTWLLELMPKSLQQSLATAGEEAPAEEGF